MYFGLYLAKQGVITTEQFVTALEIQLDSRPQVGSLAVETGKLRIKEVFQILREQADQPMKKFGELAVEASLLESDELAALLYHQSIRVQPMSEILLELDFISQKEIDHHLREYRLAAQPTPETNWQIQPKPATTLSRPLNRRSNEVSKIPQST